MLQKIGFQPGINKQITETQAEGQWTDCDNVRFRYGIPEKIGGWKQLGDSNLTGAGRGFGRILTGALFIGAGFLVPATWAIGTFGGTPILVGSTLKKLGVLMAISGVADMLSPQPDFPEMNQATQLQNFSFSGVTNVSQVGTVIPVVMGRAFCGSSVISSSLDVDQVI